MALDLLAKFSVIEKVDISDAKELFEMFITENEHVLMSYKHVRDRVIFTNKKIIAIDVQGLTGVKKEFRFFPYSKIASFSVETSGSFDADSDFKIWVSGVGCYEIRFAKKLDIKEIGKLLTEVIL